MDANKEQVTAAHNLGKLDGAKAAQEKINILKTQNYHLNKVVAYLDRVDPIGGIFISVVKAEAFIRIFIKNTNEKQQYLEQVKYLRDRLGEPVNGG